MVTKDDPRIQYGDSFGSIDPNDKFFDDNKALKYESLNYKITNIKIYFNSSIKKTMNQKKTMKASMKNTLLV